MLINIAEGLVACWKLVAPEKQVSQEIPILFEKFRIPPKILFQD